MVQQTQIQHTKATRWTVKLQKRSQSPSLDDLNPAPRSETRQGPVFGLTLLFNTLDLVAAGLGISNVCPRLPKMSKDGRTWHQILRAVE